jgi:hypothetical protein
MLIACARIGRAPRSRSDTIPCANWTIGFLLDERPELRTALPVDRPLPGALARGLEITARLALDSDTTGVRWLALLAEFERDGCHGSWCRPVLMALPRSENAFDLFERVAPALVVDKGRVDDRCRGGAARANSRAPKRRRRFPKQWPREW